MTNPKSNSKIRANRGRDDTLSFNGAKVKRISLQETAITSQNVLSAVAIKPHSNSTLSPPEKIRDSLNLNKQDQAAYRAALDLEIKFLNYNLEPLSEQSEERSIQNYFRNGRDIKRLIFLCLTRSTLVGKGITARGLMNITQSSRSYMNDSLNEIIKAGWANRYLDGASYHYFACENMLTTWLKRYGKIFQDFGKDSVMPNFLNHMVVSWGLFHIDQETNVPTDDITDIATTKKDSI